MIEKEHLPSEEVSAPKQKIYILHIFIDMNFYSVFSNYTLCSVYTVFSIDAIIPIYKVISPASDCFSISLTLRLSSNLPCRYIIFVTIASTVES